MQKSKIDFDILALRMGFRNKHWSQHFNQILILLTGLYTPGPAHVMLAALDIRGSSQHHNDWAVMSKVINKIKFWLKRCDQCLFLQPMLSVRISKSIFDFRIWIPNTTWYFNGFDYNRYNFSTIFTQQKFCGGTGSPQIALFWRVQFQFSL